MTENEKLILIAVLAALMLFIVFFELRVMRGRSKEVRQVSQRKDEAFNAILTTRHVMNVVQRQGGNTKPAQRILDQAKAAMQKGDYDRSMDLSEKARLALTNPNSAPVDEPSEGSGKSLEEVAEEVLATPKRDERQYTGTKLPIDQTSNYMSARFELNAARADISRAGAGASGGPTEALMAEAEAAFTAGNYTKALSLAVKARKSVGADGAVDTIPLRPASCEEEEPEAEPTPEEMSGTYEACGQCGEPLEDGDAFCGRCGARVARERTCGSCGAKARPDDRFCRKCGGNLV